MTISSSVPAEVAEVAKLDHELILEVGGFKSENLFLMNVQGAKSAKKKCKLLRIN